MRNLLPTALFAAAAGLSGCAEYPNRIDAVYIPSIIYTGASCDELSRERGNLVEYVRSLTAQQRRTANIDSGAMTVFFVAPFFIAWTGLVALPFTVDQSAQLSVARGHYNALEQAGQDGGCWRNTNWKRNQGDFPPLSF